MSPTEALIASQEELLKHPRVSFADDAAIVAGVLSDYGFEFAPRGTWQRIELAKGALVRTGYFREVEVGEDIAPRITELWSHLRP